MVDKTQHRKLKIGQDELLEKPAMDSGANI